MELNPKKHQRLPDGRVRLRPGHGKIATGIGLLIFAAFWLGVSGTMFVLFLGEGGLSFPLVFIGLFVVIGVAVLIGGIVVIVSGVLVGQKIAPADITVSRLPLRLGERFTLEYDQPVKQRCEIDHVTLTLVCKEWVRYTVGTDTRTAEHEVLSQEQPLMTGGEIEALGSLRAQAELAVPAEAMHSFDATNNKVSWLVKIRTAIKSWPDYTAEFPLLVEPRLMPEESTP